jgi:hypothetical protein
LYIKGSLTTKNTASEVPDSINDQAIKLQPKHFIAPACDEATLLKVLRLFADVHIPIFSTLIVFIEDDLTDLMKNVT